MTADEMTWHIDRYEWMVIFLRSELTRCDVTPQKLQAIIDRFEAQIARGRPA
jgi:hypothetical protein